MGTFVSNTYSIYAAPTVLHDDGAGDSKRTVFKEFLPDNVTFGQIIVRPPGRAAHSVVPRAVGNFIGAEKRQPPQRSSG